MSGAAAGRVRRPARLVLATLAVLLLAAPAGAPARGTTSRNIHDARYCEVLEVRGQAPAIRVAIWNTIGFGFCPQAAWEALEPAALARRLGAVAVVLNGPRHWLMDRASATRLGPVRRFGSIRMRRVATIRFRSAEELQQVPYLERTILRTNTWTWRRGRRIHELTAPGGARYVMQSYSLQVDPAQTLRSLPRLGARLALPPGWRFSSRRLRGDLVLRAAGRAVVIRDELQNTYQRYGG